MTASSSSLDEALDRLSAVPPRDFTKERSALAARLTKAGQSAAAAKVKAQRAPTIPVWAVNRLAHEHARLVEALAAAAERVGAAQLGRGATIPLGAAMTAYREATDAVVARLDELLAAAGVRASHQLRLRIQNTLMAAAADPKTRDALRAGRIEQELAASGFDLFSGAIPARATASSRSDREPAPRRESAAESRAATPGTRRDRTQEARDRREAAREERERRRREAREAADRAKAARAARLQPLQDASDAAAKALGRAREEARRATAAVADAVRQKRAADQALAAAHRPRRDGKD